MEPKLDNFKNLRNKFNENTTENASNINSCNIDSCDYCKGRSYISINKNRNNKSHEYNPKAPEKFFKYHECKYCNRILSLIERNRNDYYINWAISINSTKQAREHKLKQK